VLTATPPPEPSPALGVDDGARMEAIGIGMDAIDQPGQRVEFGDGVSTGQCRRSRVMPAAEQLDRILDDKAAAHDAGGDNGDQHNWPSTCHF